MIEGNPIVSTFMLALLGGFVGLLFLLAIDWLWRHRK